MDIKLSIILVLLFFAHHLTAISQVKAVKAESSSSSPSPTSSREIEEYMPVPLGAKEYRVLQGNVGGADARRRSLAPFQLCLLCKCCAAGGGGAASASTSSTCTTMPCCFGIDCQLPNKPFGVCAFVPKTCNCNSCAA